MRNGDGMDMYDELLKEIMMEVEEELSEQIPEEKEIASWHHFSEEFIQKSKVHCGVN